MPTVNRIYVVIDKEAERNVGLHKAIAINRFYSNISAPRRICAMKNYHEGYLRYAVATLDFIENKSERKSYTFEYEKVDTPYGLGTNEKLVTIDECEACKPEKGADN